MVGCQRTCGEGRDGAGLKIHRSWSVLLLAIWNGGGVASPHPSNGLSTERNPRSSKLSESGYSTLGCRIQVGQGNLERLTTRQNLRAGKRLRLYGVLCLDVSDLTQQQNLCLPPHFLDVKQHTHNHADTCRDTQITIANMTQLDIIKAGQGHKGDKHFCHSTRDLSRTCFCRGGLLNLGQFLPPTWPWFCTIVSSDNLEAEDKKHFLELMYISSRGYVLGMKRDDFMELALIPGP